MPLYFCVKLYHTLLFTWCCVLCFSLLLLLLIFWLMCWFSLSQQKSNVSSHSWVPLLHGRHLILFLLCVFFHWVVSIVKKMRALNTLASFISVFHFLELRISFSFAVVIIILAFYRIYLICSSSMLQIRATSLTCNWKMTTQSRITMSQLEAPSNYGIFSF